METIMTDERTRDGDPTRTNVDRRTFLGTTGGLVVAGLLAGCSSDENDGGATGKSSVGEWLSKTNNYDSVADMTRKKAVTVEVGPSENEFVFEPPAIRIDAGTAVTWKWVGSGHHNVVAADGGFESGPPEERATFEHTFDSVGTTLYYCQPHKSMGMKGAVVVAGGDEGTGASN